MPFLTPEQFEQLQGLLTACFDKRGIEELVRKKLENRLENLVNPEQPTPGVVFELLTWTEKRGLHTLEVLLQGAIGERPGDRALREFCEQVIPGALKPFDSQAFVKNLTSGLNVLIDMKDVSAVCETVGRVRAQLEATNGQIDILKEVQGIARLPARARSPAVSHCGCDRTRQGGRSSTQPWNICQGFEMVGRTRAGSNSQLAQRTE
jgi:hypothetical protein